MPMETMSCCVSLLSRQVREYLSSGVFASHQSAVSGDLDWSCLPGYGYTTHSRLKAILVCVSLGLCVCVRAFAFVVVFFFKFDQLISCCNSHIFVDIDLSILFRGVMRL